MTLITWVLLASACLAGAASPGPSIALLSKTVMDGGRRAGVIFGLAHGLGIFLYAILTTVGLSYFLVSNNQIFYLIKLLGIMFLFLIGFKKASTALHLFP